MTTIPIRFDWWWIPVFAFVGLITAIQERHKGWWIIAVLALVGLWPADSFVRINGNNLNVKMGWRGWGFTSDIPHSSITRAAPYAGRVWSWGVHGWRDHWLVNGSSNGIVELTIEPSARAYVVGVPVKLRRLRVSVTEPDALITACTAA